MFLLLGLVSTATEADDLWKNEHFLAAKECALCHANSSRANAMRDAKNRPIAPFDLWQSSMMANSARDPFWKAAVSAEIAAVPSQQAVIEELCTRCHAPMAGSAPMSLPGETLTYLNEQNERAHLGLDGVSCTVCHQIAAENLGDESSFTGRFEINADRKIFGPHARPVTMPMQRHVNYTPTEGAHVMQSAMCATCHTVITHSVDLAGEETSHPFHEQSPYLEWRNSQFNDELESRSDSARSCQGCHMPQVDIDGKRIATNLAHNPGGRDFPFLNPRTPFGRHTLVGANAFMTRILRDNADLLGVTAPRAALDASLSQIKHVLQNETAELTVGKIKQADNALHVPVIIKNLAGHKLPTAYPSRRVWIRLLVKNQQQEVVFASGQFNEQGQLIDQRGQVLTSELAGGPLLPHYDRIDGSDQAQVYETLMTDLQGKPTFRLLYGAAYLKDNRILPLGWSPVHADAKATRPFGVDGDENFVSGMDQTDFIIPLDSLAGRLSDDEVSVEVSLHYQVVSPRYAAEMFQYSTAEIEQFKAIYDRAQNLPETIATPQVKTVQLSKIP
jgi:hypothetical protein